MERRFLQQIKSFGVSTELRQPRFDPLLIKDCVPWAIPDRRDRERQRRHGILGERQDGEILIPHSELCRKVLESTVASAARICPHPALSGD